LIEWGDEIPDNIVETAKAYVDNAAAKNDTGDWWDGVWEAMLRQQVPNARLIKYDELATNMVLIYYVEDEDR
jgi:hypothetical protein